MKVSTALGLAALLLLTLIVQGCSQTTPAVEGVPASATDRPEDDPQDQEAGGARLWEQNCSRCHYYRQPLTRSDQEWAIIVHHMRVRANLTAEEQRKITRFLQAAN